MKTIDFLARSFQKGIILNISEENIRFKIPLGESPDVFKEEVNKRKDEIISILGRNKKYALTSSSQERLWYLCNLESNGAAYNMRRIYRVFGSIDLRLLEDSYKNIILKHEILRTNFIEVNGEVLQVVLPNVEWTLEVIDIRMLEPTLKEQKIKTLLHFEGCTPFDLEKDLLFRFKIIYTNINEYILVFVIHHIIADARSLDIISKGIRDFYNNPDEIHSEADLQNSSFQYIDYSIQQRLFLKQERYIDQMRFWKKKLSDVQDLQIFTDKLRPPIQRYKGNKVTDEIDINFVNKLNHLLSESGVSLFLLLLTAFKILLFKYTNQTSIPLGIPVTNRTNKDIKDTIGFFLNTLVINTEIKHDEKFLSLLGKVKRNVLEAYDNQEIPFSEIVRELQPQRDLSRNPFFQVMFAYQDDTEEKFQLNETSIQLINVEQQFSKFDLTLYVKNSDNGLKLILEYATDLYNFKTVSRMLNYYKTILKRIIHNPNDSITNISSLPEEEKLLLINKWNSTDYHFVDRACLHQFLERQAKLTPEKTAIIHNDKIITYCELNQMANRLANYIIRKSLMSSSIIGICLDRSIEMIIGIFGILKAGNCYLPINPEYPVNRVNFFIDDSRAPLVLTCQNYRNKFVERNIMLLCVDEERVEIDNENSEDVNAYVNQKSAAYIIYTSGTTGKPKGVIINHEAIVNHLNWMQKQYKLDANARLMQKTNNTFDISAWELFWWVWSGASLSILNSKDEKDPEKIVQTMLKDNVAVIVFVPSMLNVFLDYINNNKYDIRYLKRVLCIGEELTTSLVKKFNVILGKRHNVQLSNLYGPTEATVAVSFFDIDNQKEYEKISIGRPIDNVQLLIINKKNELVPIGVLGELCISGIALSDGYLNNQQLSHERFSIINPDNFEKKIYRTGDLARYLPDGNIEFLGRTDRQIKVRGFRIELSEIESVIQKIDGVVQNIVIHSKQNDENQLIAFIIADQSLSPLTIRKNIREELPDYMIPTKIHFIDSMPMTSHQKVDFAFLQDKVRKDVPHKTIRSPETEMQKILVEELKATLQIENIGLDDSFFDLGGHSLMLIKFSNSLSKRLHKKIALKEFYYNNIEQLAQLYNK